MLETTIAGSLPKPSWLAEPEKLWAPWRLEGDDLEQGKKDASLIWLKEQEDADIDIVSGGEQFRVHFVHGFLEHIDGIDWDKKTKMGIRDNRYVVDVPTVTGPLGRKGSVHAEEARFLRASTRHKLKFTLPGPMTICDTIADAHYGKRADMAMAFADLLNQEAKELEAQGVDLIQFDEPAFNVFMDDVKEWGVEALHRARDGLTCTTAVHICYGYGIQENLDWKETLGSEWRQYEEIFPALNASRIDQVSLECANSKVPMSLLGSAEGQGAHGRRHRCRLARGRDAPAGRRHHQGSDEACRRRPDQPVHQLRHGAPAPFGGVRQAEGAGRRHGPGARGTWTGLARRTGRGDARVKHGHDRKNSLFRLARHCRARHTAVRFSM